ncbi:hypothetical protein [Crocosphaera chwakensis]|uniref:Uncharacterized protein n=1 Tax=Crocosphaera chwakensis CCY0110 TaxID=391612 RepID=A3IP96_9CHRO|nr:hypothetical protein [Crocosphaera chwakensis]EAZ91661.1 hypothetical protein CY0110_26058 [Crocosphaera chwakensis CCY0110]
MKHRNFIFFSCLVLLGTTMISIGNHKISNNNSFAQSYQEQQTSVNLSLSDLDSPCILSISSSPSETQLTGEISLNGQLIKSFTGHNNEINLSPYLMSGQQIISISGHYTPSHSSVKIELTGNSTHISQETGGSGQIKQQLIFNIQ